MRITERPIGAAEAYRMSQHASAPRAKTFELLGRKGNPNRLLEEMAPERALAVVTAEHRALADWLKAEIVHQGWNAAKPPREAWPYITVIRALKSARRQLEELVESLWMDDADESNLARDAQAEADRLSESQYENMTYEEWLNS